MQPETAEKLLELNHQFYQTFAEDFSATRQRLQPGVLQIAQTVPATARILDLGCGNGLLAAYLHQHSYRGAYTGIDTSARLIEIARSQARGNTHFLEADLARPDWSAGLPSQGFDHIFCYAVMHHIPGDAARLDLLQQVRRLLAPDGRFILSNWQFLESKRLQARIVPWETIGLSSDQVDEHDFLMDWRRGGKGLRYVHYFTSRELYSLASAAGFKVSGMFTSDGENSRLGLYHIWEHSSV